MDGVPAQPELTSQSLTARIAEFVVVAFCTLAFAFTALGVVHSLLEKNSAGQRDFVEYWASGQLLAHHANPYDGDAVLKIERTAGLSSDQPPLIMGNAPPALLLALPLGYLSPTRAELVWILLLLASLALSVEATRRAHRRPQSTLQLIAYSFGPALSCILSGQMSMLVLLGLALFLCLSPSRPGWAGASLWLCLLKPQLFLPFGIVLLAWAVASRRYRLIGGTLVAFAASSILISVIDPAIWTQYHITMSALRYDRGVLPCLSNLFRRMVAPGAVWVQYVPAAAGCAWAADYYRRHRANWDWTSHGSLLMLVSLAVAPYTWLTDQVVLIPALMHGLYVTRSRALVAALALASATVQLSIFGGGTRLLHSAWVVWTAPFWLVWYLLATRRQLPRPADADRAATT